MTKPMLASDWNEDKLQLTTGLQPKIDGVRALHITGGLTGRSLKKHANLHVSQLFSNELFTGLDGEMAAECETHPALCRLTTSALNSINGEPWILWHVFDYITAETIGLPYIDRYEALKDRVDKICKLRPVLGSHLKLIPYVCIKSKEELLLWDDKWSTDGYEGSIIRDPNGKYKSGRSTVREGALLRIKRFVEEEALVLDIAEGHQNNNVVTVNELGKTARSTHQENMVSNGMVGSLLCRDIKTGKDINVSAGSMPHEDRILYFKQRALIVGKVIKYKCFPKGVKDKPRFPTFQTIRADSDI